MLLLIYGEYCMPIKTKFENKKILVDHKIIGEERKQWNLEIDAVYCADKALSKTLAGEVLSKVFYGIGNAGGFRISGPISKPRYIVIYTSGDDIYWRDEVDNTLGGLLYYGDNRTPGKDLHNTKKGGNRILRDVFMMAASDDVEVRKGMPPIFVFKKYNNSRDMQFIGLAVPGIKGKAKKDWLTAVWGCNKEGNRFLNYKAFFTILDTSKGYKDEVGSNISLAWLNDIDSGNIFDSEYVPSVWKNYVSKLEYHPLMCKTEKYVKSKDEQLPKDKEELKMLEVIHDYFINKDNVDGTGISHDTAIDFDVSYNLDVYYYKHYDFERTYDRKTNNKCMKCEGKRKHEYENVDYLKLIKKLGYVSDRDCLIEDDE